MTSRRTRVYVAGPITSSGNLLDNVHKAVMAGDELLHQGFAPYVPHLNCLWEMISGARSYELWLQLDMDFLSTCDALVRLPGVSSGADREVAFAIGGGIPAYYSVEAVVVNEPVTRIVSLDESHDADQRNIGADLAAKRLRTITETGRHVGTFGSPEMEAAAQAILKLHRRVLV